MAKEKDGVKPMDLAALDTIEVSETGAVCEILHPVENTKLGIKIRVVGADSNTYRTFVNKSINKRIQRAKPGKLTTFSAEEQDESGLELLAHCTLGWEGVVVDGQELPFSKENAKFLYQRFPWLREQVDFFIGDRANFLAK